MSYNPYSFDQYTSTPTTPTSAYPWETEQPHLDLASVPQAQGHHPQAQAQPPFDPSQLQALQAPQVHHHSAYPSEPRSAGGLSSGSVRADSAPADAVTASRAEGMGSGAVTSPVTYASAQSLTGSSMPAEASRPASAMSTISLRPASRAGAAGWGTNGPVRAPRTYGGADGVHGAHPYRRTSGGGGGASGSGVGGATPRQSPEASGSMSATPAATRETPPVTQLRFLHYQGPPPKAPLPSVTTMACPAGGSRRALGMSRATSLAPSLSSSSQHEHPPFASSHLAGPAMTTTVNSTSSLNTHLPATIPPHSQVTRPAEQRTRVFHLRADVHYDPPSRIMTVMMEVPGVRKSDLRVTLHRCPFSRVKQLTVRGHATPTFPEEGAGYCLRERRFGDFVRTLALPPDTMKDDVFVGVEDGVLTIKIPVGPPAAPEEAVEIQLR